MADIDPGEYDCDDGGTYWVSLRGNKVYWSGKGPTFSNVFVGTMSQDGDWGDIPPGDSQGQGTITLKIIDLRHFTKVKSTGGFGGSNWSIVGPEIKQTKK